MALAWNLIFSCLIGGFLIFFAIIGIRIANIIDTFSSPGPVAIIVIMLLLCCGKPFVLWIVAQSATACRKKQSNISSDEAFLDIIMEGYELTLVLSQSVSLNAR